ncbi:MAG: DUF1819 family protein [Bacteroidales bacterium]
MTDQNKYSFSFTTSSLRLNEMVMVANHLVKGRSLDVTSELGNGNTKTGGKMFSEMKKRIANLTPLEVEILLQGDLVAQRQMAFLSICKTYGFIRDFVVEVLFEKMLVFDYQITDGEYLSFFRRKAELHPEMDKLTEITQSKIRQVIFKMMEQAGIINHVKTKVLLPQLLEGSIVVAIREDDPDLLKVFLLNDSR